ncbi:hypothetical protein BHM03_00023207 [Ensete ventricosum]|nr:hypothetical protein BHM03_00023207 [Ensete ventricosum]
MLPTAATSTPLFSVAIFQSLPFLHRHRCFPLLSRIDDAPITAAPSLLVASISSKKEHHRNHPLSSPHCCCCHQSQDRSRSRSSSFYRCHYIPFQPSLAPTGTDILCSHTKYDITNVMVMDDALDARFKASEARIEDRLQQPLCEFKRSRSEKYDHGQDIGYPCKREEFPKWKDLVESMVEIASTKLEGDTI